MGGIAISWKAARGEDGKVISYDPEVKGSRGNSIAVVSGYLGNRASTPKLVATVFEVCRNSGMSMGEFEGVGGVFLNATKVTAVADAWKFVVITGEELVKFIKAPTMSKFKDLGVAVSKVITNGTECFVGLVKLGALAVGSTAMKAANIANSGFKLFILDPIDLHKGWVDVHKYTEMKGIDSTSKYKDVFAAKLYSGIAKIVCAVSGFISHAISFVGAAFSVAMNAWIPLGGGILLTVTSAVKYFFEEHASKVELKAGLEEYNATT